MVHYIISAGIDAKLYSTITIIQYALFNFDSFQTNGLSYFKTSLNNTHKKQVSYMFASTSSADI